MQNLSVKSVFKLSLILLAFGAYPKTEGLPEREKATISDFSQLWTTLFTHVLKCPSSVGENVTACVSKASRTVVVVGGKGTDAKKNNAVLISMVRCIENGVDVCVTDPGERAALKNDFNKAISEHLSSSGESSAGAHHTKFLMYFFVLALAVSNLL